MGGATQHQQHHHTQLPAERHRSPITDGRVQIMIIIHTAKVISCLAEQAQIREGRVTVRMDTLPHQAPVTALAWDMTTPRGTIMVG